MVSRKTQILRHVFIDRKIREGMRSGWLANCTNLAAEYEVSTKSILRDIDYLRYQLDAPIVYDPTKKGYYYSEENYKLPAISMNESDLFALCIARKALQQHENTPLYRKLARIFARIESGLPGTVTIDPSWIENRLTVIERRQAGIDADIWDAVARGLKENRTMAISYRKPGAAEETQRKVDPCHIALHKGQWYLLGFCHRRREVVTFALGRVKAVRVLNETFTPPADVDFAAELQGQFGIFRGSEQYEVRIAFEADIAPFVREQIWHVGQEIGEMADGGIVLAFPATHLLEVKRWVLSWGSGARVLSPPELCAEVRAELRRTLQSYEVAMQAGEQV